MKRITPIIKPLTLACCLALAACGSSSSSDDDNSGGGGTTPTTINGKAEAPGGVLAQFETNKPILLATLDFIVPAAYAAITGLQPVGGATVELIRIDDDGNQVGAVLASTVTSISGDYSLALPTGVSLAGNLIVRISGSTESMSAMVVDQAVDINPVSQFVLDKFVDVPNLVLADLAVNEVVALNGKVDEFDLTATADLSTMLAQLEAEVGQFVDNEVAVIDSTPDDGTAAAAVAGNWRIIDMSLGLHDSDPATSGIQFGTFAIDVAAEDLTITDGSNGALTLTVNSVLIDAFTNYSTDDMVITSLYHEISINEVDGESFPATIDSAGNMSISTPFEEELETVDILQDPDGPDFGWRYPPSSILLNPVANGNTYVLNNIEAGVRFETTDTDNDGVKDAVDPNARSGDEVSMELLLALKQGTGMTTASLDGDFGWVALNTNHDTTPSTGIIDSTVGLMNFNAGTVTVQANAQDVVEITRTPVSLSSVTLTDSSSTEPATTETFPYAVTATGQVTLDFAGDLSDVLEGITNDDGSVITFIGSEATGAPSLTNVNNEMDIFVKLGSAMASSLNSATYQLFPMVVGMGTDGFTEISSLTGTITFDATSATATVDGTDRGFGRGTDVAEVEAIIPEGGPAEVFTVNSVAANGAVSLSRTEMEGAETLTQSIEGYVSADSNLLIMRVFNSDTIGDRDIGIVVGIKQ